MIGFIVVMALSAGPRVSIDRALPGFDAGAVLQLETPPVPDAGVGKSKLDRRIELVERLEALKVHISREAKIETFAIYWATMNVDSEHDAAVVTTSVDGKASAIFFYYKNGAWLVLHEQFEQ